MHSNQPRIDCSAPRNVFSIQNIPTTGQDGCPSTENETDFLNIDKFHLISKHEGWAIKDTQAIQMQIFKNENLTTIGGKCNCVQGSENQRTVLQMVQKWGQEILNKSQNHSATVTKMCFLSE